MTKKLRYFCTLLLMAVASVAWADTGTIKFGNNGIKIVAGTVDPATGQDDLNNTWTVTTVGTTSFTPQTDYQQFGSGSKPATSITFTTTLKDDIEIKSMSAKFGGFSGTAGTVSLKVGDTEVGSGSLDGTNDVTVSSTNTATGKVLTVTVTNIAKGVKCYEISYSYSGETPVKVPAGLAYSETSFTAEIGSSFTAPTLTNPNNLTVSYSSSDSDIASVNTTTGAVTIGSKAGPVTITASSDETDNYEAGEASYTIFVIDPNAPGTANNPYTVAEAIEYINTLEANTLSPTDVYVKGVVSQIDSYVGDRYITYWISDDGTTDNQMEVFKGLGLDGAFFTAKTDLTVGDKVTVCGKVKLYKNNSGTTIIPEFDTGSKIVSLEENTDPYVEAEDVELAYDATEGEIAYTINNEPSTGFNLTVSSDSEWLTARPGADVISLSCTENTGYDARTATVTIKITYDSKVVTKDVTVTQDGAPAIFDNIEDMFEAATSFGNKATDVSVKFGGWVVTGASSNNVFVSDGTHGFIIYAKNHGFKVDDVLTSEEAISCKLQLYNGSAEITALTAETVGLTVTTNEGDDTYATVSMAELSGVNTGALVSYENLTCSKDGNNCYLSDGETTLKVFTTLYSEAISKFEDGMVYNVEGVFQQFNNNQGDTKEILPRSELDIVTVLIVEPEPVEVEIGESGYATLYYSDKALIIPEGVKASYVVDVNGKQLVTEELTEVIPAGMAVILEGEPDIYEFNVTDNAVAIIGNMLFGTDEEGMIEDANADDYYYYKLVVEDDVVGFWWGAEGGGLFTNGAHKAYLRVRQDLFNSSSSAKVLYLFGGEGGVSTGINNVEKIAEGAAIYNLNGVRVNKMQKGVYVVNGKKVVIK